MTRMRGTDYPALFQLADGSSTAGQRSYKRLTSIELALGVAGASFGALAAIAGADWRASAVLAAVSFLGAGSAKLLARIGGHEADWFNGRAVAETVKSLTWRYITHAPPFEDDSSADASFIELLGQTVRTGPLIRPRARALLGDAAQITSAMREARRLPLPELRDLYVAARIEEQGDWYRRRAVTHERARERWFFIALGAQGIAVLIAIAGAFAEVLTGFNVLGLAAAIAAGATAWSQVGRYDEQSRAYALASQELLLIASLAPAVADAGGLARLVITAESAISREHTIWVAKRTDSWPSPSAEAPDIASGRT